VGPANGERLDFARALVRSAAVPLMLMLILATGVGFLSFLAIVGLVLAGARLRAGHAPWWDALAGVRVTYGDFTAARRTAATAALMAAIFAAVLAASFARRS
jgi:hypothetical protein